MSTAEAQDFYRPSIAAIEQDLYGGGGCFPITVQLGQQTYEFHVWAGEQLPDRLLAYDTETAMIQGREIPRLAMATVYGDAGSAYLIHPAQLPQFIQQHSNAFWCCHSAVFDFWVTAQHLGNSPPSQIWWTSQATADFAAP